MQYLGQIKREVSNAYSKDLQKAIIKAIPKGTKQVFLFSRKFKSINPLFTARKVWEYLRTKIRYEKDHPKNQRIFLPSAFITFKKGDCKSYAVFASSIFTSLGIKNGLVFSSYKSRTIPSHVYNYIEYNGKSIPVDGCYSVFGKQKKPLYIRKVKIL